tara:strand:+ start:563 stop:730 length:168 start_codon:yes stop_codon:yes gene_type:complete
MTITSDPAEIKQKEIKTEWPVEEGLTAGTQKQTGRTTNLVIQEQSLVPDRVKVGF